MRLYAIADEPICDFSNGSSICFRCCNNLISFENLYALCDIRLRTFKICESSFLGYVWPLTGKHLS